VEVVIRVGSDGVNLCFLVATSDCDGGGDDDGDDMIRRASHND